MENDTHVLQRRALKAIREKARRSRSPGYVARENSQAADLRRAGVSPDAYYSRLRRERLKAANSRDGVSWRPGVITHGDGNSCPVPAVAVIDGIPCREGVSCPATTTDLSDGVSCSPWSPEIADLLRRVRCLPGGRDPSLRNSLARLIADAPASRAAWESCDPDLAALLNSED